MNVSVEIRSNRLGTIAAGMRPKARALVAKAVADVEAQAKVRAAVDTGALRNSIQGRMTGDTEGEVAVGVDYAIYQEYGTRTMPAHPFLTPAAEAVRPAFEAAAAKLAEV